jgi:hypothetical protein
MFYTRHYLQVSGEIQVPADLRRSEHFLRTASFGMLRRVARVRTDVSEELSTSIIRVTRIG